MFCILVYQYTETCPPSLHSVRSHADPSGKGKGGVLVRVIERTAGSYDVQEVECGCDCGERPILISSATTCECGADYAAIVREEFTARRPER